MPDRRDDEAVIAEALKRMGANPDLAHTVQEANAALASLSLRLQNAETALANAWGHLNDEKYLHSDRERILMIRAAIAGAALASSAERAPAQECHICHRPLNEPGGLYCSAGHPPEREPERVTHGRHCPCTACAREDWTRITSPCGMHGAGCPNVYAPVAAEREPESETA